MIRAGDTVKVLNTNDGYGSKIRDKYIDKYGRVQCITGDGDIRVRFIDGASFEFAPQTLMRVNFNFGDRVKVLEHASKYLHHSQYGYRGQCGVVDFSIYDKIWVEFEDGAILDFEMSEVINFD